MTEKKNEYNLQSMTIVELSSYHNIVKTMIDSCLFKLKFLLPQDEKVEINTKRLKYNDVLDKIETELNNRIEQICNYNE